MCLSASSNAYDDICKDRGYLDSCLEQLPPLMSKNGTTGIPNSKKQVDAVCRLVTIVANELLGGLLRGLLREKTHLAEHPTG
ncbi:hypothetical protein RUM44_009100 [Polyplax serrata]|uniref:Uncharacterized protein n=1 Tax=Polyplax serrata TaxID=468196 RepID=A0ABR1ARQ1_POLSC